MSDYIKREDVINIINYWWGDSIAQWLVKKIKNVPSADAAPVRHGHWEVIDAEEPRRYGCSECKRLSWYMENYCGNCGARMDGESDD